MVNLITQRSVVQIHPPQPTFQSLARHPIRIWHHLGTNYCVFQAFPAGSTEIA
jgi:hypothetical protein